MRSMNEFEKAIVEIVNEYTHRFYYQEIKRCFESEDFKLSIEKGKEEMVGYATVELKTGATSEYEIRYNRITNKNEGYTLVIS